MVWVREHREALQLAGAIVFVLLLLVLDLSLIGFLLLVVVVGLYEIWLFRLGAGASLDEPSRP